MGKRLTRRRLAVSSAVLATLAAGTLTVTSGGLVSAASKQPLSHEAWAKSLIEQGRARFSTQAMQHGLEFASGQRPSPGRALHEESATSASPASGGARPLARAGLRNVRVNDPGQDTHEVDQTTQSETTIAVSGRHVAVGFNDSQQALAGFTDGLDLSGYAYSEDGGRTFTDGGTLPNAAGYANVGDPWMTTDRSGRMYYATLTYDGEVGNIEIGVGSSRNGGRTWSAPVVASPNDPDLFYFGDKEAITAGRDPKAASRDNLYAAWDDFVYDPETGDNFNGLPVATSTDHGANWSVHYVDKLVSDPTTCSFAQYIGAQPMVDPSDGTLYVAAEKITVTDPDCTGGTESFSQVLFTSEDAGATFSPGVTVATIEPAAPTGALRLGPGELVRTIEFPVMAQRDGTLWMAWNEGTGGRSHIRLATSTDRGAHWTLRWATRGSGDEIQPALSVDRSGLHLAYYQRNYQPDEGNTFDTVLADSITSGATWRARAVTSRPFPGVHTSPQFDPQIATGYMGDYIANVSDGTHLYLAWGDNRDRIVNFTHPQGRHDPNVYFARR